MAITKKTIFIQISSTCAKASGLWARLDPGRGDWHAPSSLHHLFFSAILLPGIVSCLTLRPCS